MPRQDLDLILSVAVVALAVIVVPIVAVHTGTPTTYSSERALTEPVQLQQLSKTVIRVTPFEGGRTPHMKLVKSTHRFLVATDVYGRFFGRVPHLEYVVSNGYITYASTKDGKVYKFHGGQAVDRYHASGAVICLLADPQLKHVFVQETTQIVDATQGWSVVAAFDRPVQCTLGQEGLVILDRQVWSLFA